jgi:hypothetical protein
MSMACDLLERRYPHMRIRLIRKPALRLNGVDVSEVSVGDIVDLPERSARLLLVEGWAEPAPGNPPAPTSESEPTGSSY